MGLELVRAILDGAPASGASLLILIALAAEADDVTAEVRLPQSRIARLARSDEGHTRRLVAALTAAGVVEQIEPPSGRRPALLRLCVDRAPTRATDPVDRASTRALQRAVKDEAITKTRPPRPANLHASALEPIAPDEDQPRLVDVPTSTRPQRKAAAAKRPPREHETTARAVLDAAWKQLNPKPATPYVACVRIVETIIAAGWDPHAVEAAIVAAPTISIRSLEFQLRQRANNNTGDRRPIITDRTTPGGMTQL